MNVGSTRWNSSAHWCRCCSNRASPSLASREHGVNANQVFSWRRLYQEGCLGVPALMRDDGLLPMMLAPPAPAPGNATIDVGRTIMLELGQVCVRIEGQSNAAALAQVLDRVLR